MSKPFASQGDLAEKTITFRQISDHGWVFETGPDPTTGVIIGDDSVMVIDGRATPDLAEEVIAEIRKVTDKPIRYVVMSHYHAVRVLGAPAYEADHIICSELTLEMIRERGEADFKSEVGRFPRLFQNVEAVKGLTYPTITFSDAMTVWLGDTEVQLKHLGRGHTKGDIVVQLPAEGVVFSGDLVENGASVYMGDSHPSDWLNTLERVRALDATALVPGRGPAVSGREDVNRAIDRTRDFIATLHNSVGESVRQGLSLADTYVAARKVMDPKFGDWPIYEHCIPFDVSRSYDEHKGIDNPRVWTDERDRELWDELQGS